MTRNTTPLKIITLIKPHTTVKDPLIGIVYPAGECFLTHESLVADDFIMAKDIEEREVCLPSTLLQVAKRSVATTLRELPEHHVHTSLDVMIGLEPRPDGNVFAYDPCRRRLFLVPSDAIEAISCHPHQMPVAV